MKANSYIFEKVIVAVDTANMETANVVKNGISSFLQDDVFPQLESVLDDLNQSDTIIRIDSLDLSIVMAHFNWDEIKAEIVRQFSDQLNRKLSLSPKKIKTESKLNGVEIVPLEESQKELFLYFLENGYLPWNGKVDDVLELVQPDYWQKSLDDTTFTTKLKRLLAQSKAAVDRFLFQFETKVILAFLWISVPEIKNEETIISKFTGVLSRNSQNIFFQLLLLASVKRESSELHTLARELGESLRLTMSEKSERWKIELEERLSSILQKTELFSVDDRKKLFKIILSPFEKESEQVTSFKNKDEKDGVQSADYQDKVEEEAEVVNKLLNKKPKDKNKQEPFFDKNKNEIALQNTGLILLHPFLKTIFTKLDFLDEKGGIKKTELQIAIQTLHYLATGKEEFFEANLVFEKFLCGIPLKMPTERESFLTRKIKDECQLLLTESISHWPALKNTSPDGLRQLFIQRDGKLIQKDGNFKLILERKAQDVLLDKLKWNISMIKLPWKKELISVEW